MIYFGGKWAGMLRNRQQLMQIFARQNRVLFIERERRFKETLRGFHPGKLELPGLWHSPVRQISENLFVLRHPVWAPTSDRLPFLLKQLAGIAGRLSLRNAVRKLRMSESIVWFSHPEWLGWIDEIPLARLRLYHAFDEFASYQHLTLAGRRQIEEQEKEMMAQVDAIIVVSKGLYETKRPFNANTYLVPNGVNYQSYSDALADPHLPDELQSIKSPRLGYSGTISNKLNLPMLKKLAQENPDWSLVLLGGVHALKELETWRALQAMPNVHYLGQAAWSQVPHYVKGFDVGLMPYVQDRHSETISPLKLYDYLAAGIPIASMDIPAAREFIPHVHLAESPWDFPQAVRAALADTTPERRQARRNIAAQHTWESRVEQLSDLIEAQLAAKALKGEAG